MCGGGLFLQKNNYYFIKNHQRNLVVSIFIAIFVIEIKTSTIMTNTELLYKDLSARTLYGVKVKCNDGHIFTFDKMHMGIGMLYTDYYRQPLESPDIILSGCFYGNDIKPLLFPLSSMTPKQKAELAHLTADIDGIFEQVLAEIEFYHKHHIDYRGLIEMGLAIDATGLGIYE